MSGGKASSIDLTAHLKDGSEIPVNSACSQREQRLPSDSKKVWISETSLSDGHNKNRRGGYHLNHLARCRTRATGNATTNRCGSFALGFDAHLRESVGVATQKSEAITAACARALAAIARIAAFGLDTWHVVQPSVLLLIAGQ